MANVSVERTIVQGGMSCCQVSIQELDSATKSLHNRYQQAGSSGWGDSKYRELGAIVDDCCRSLERSVSGLEDCTRKLQELLRAVEAYEQTRM